MISAPGHPAAAAGSVSIGSRERLVPVPRWRRWVWGPVKFAVGGVLTQSILGSLSIVGWAQRYMQRTAFRVWWQRSPRRTGSFDEFAALEPMLHPHRHAPNWLLGQNFGPTIRKTLSGAENGPRRFAGALRAVLGSALDNGRLGLQATLNVGALTWPGAALWAMGWWGGWQNSFHKGYEGSVVGPLVSVLGIALFISAMIYVPMALARQAVSGRWQAFWQVRTVGVLIRCSWFSSLMLALAFGLLNVPVMALKTWPQFLPQARLAGLAERGLDPTQAFERGIERVDWSQLSDADALGLLNVHFFWAGFFVFAAFLLLRRMAARLYARAVIRAVRRGALGEEELGENEWRLLHTLSLLQAPDVSGRHVVVRAVTWAGTRVGRSVCIVALAGAWFAFVGSIYVSEFLAYHPVVGWFNQPLVQLPWFRYIPPALGDPVGEPVVTAAFIAVGWVAWRLAGGRRRRSSVGIEPVGRA